ncbi:hypothetical protein [Apilactobacillus timberlakei]|uniref:hypothetical protein n=1 Tax=Apilactobacillus timberlakei TaxID=2008380 RepID=UPI00112A9804|nr:hypothetical protein [Apilactobacillus timberlakei]TPR16645.1 hypothetical protein DYZ95_07325 [Apilactobacillus timberlakei]
MADNTAAYPKVVPMNAVIVNSDFKQNVAPYGLRGMAILNESDHEGIQSYRSMSDLEQDYSLDSNVWKQAKAYFDGLNDFNGLFQVINFDRNYGDSTGGPIIPPVNNGGNNSPSNNSDGKPSSDDSKGGNK